MPWSAKEMRFATASSLWSQTAHARSHSSPTCRATLNNPSWAKSLIAQAFFAITLSASNHTCALAPRLSPHLLPPPAPRSLARTPEMQASQTAAIQSHLVADSPHAFHPHHPASAVRILAAVAVSKLSETTTLLSAHCSIITGPSSVVICAIETGQLAPAQACTSCGVALR
jgi:hypothetical protein